MPGEKSFAAGAGGGSPEALEKLGQFQRILEECAASAELVVRRNGGKVDPEAAVRNATEFGQQMRKIGDKLVEAYNLLPASAAKSSFVANTQFGWLMGVRQRLGSNDMIILGRTRSAQATDASRAEWVAECQTFFDEAQRVWINFNTPDTVREVLESFRESN